MNNQICRVVKVEEPFGTRYYAERQSKFLPWTFWEKFYINLNGVARPISALKERNKARNDDPTMTKWADPKHAERHCIEYMRLKTPDKPIKVWSIDETEGNSNV